MKKSTLKQLAANYGINTAALKQTLKADGIDRKSATLQEVLECIFVNALALEIVHIEIPNEGKRPFM